MPPPDDLDWQDLGAGHRFSWVVGDAERYPADERLVNWRGGAETLVGIIEDHERAGEPGRRCGGMLLFLRPLAPSEREAQRPVWELLSLDPLHIEPSVHCVKDEEHGGCGSHGYIRGGRWTEA